VITLFWHIFALIVVTMLGVTATLCALVSSTNRYEDEMTPDWQPHILLAVGLALGAATVAGFFAMMGGWFFR
jgi:putative Mn2+ efflux pump MntP